ncbi:nitronate monooxygenase family protein [Paeniglutamicibacter psychrophenolicus]|uniref:Nitronate monooxygenase n=1 Tax=Paeniglutamicibacter psychrophenolicus TaxID=257454 RepID=A0ABS4W9I9_9MICC|nr:nitronate monooxygenase family protein [Paeniglutamicibacter psychrophenolicus]MBP2372874.1 nitronate monooxygenase [Paeniglutamicibacter psychrophenolicus]
MATFDELKAQLALPVVAAPMFIISNPELVIEQCLNGIVGSFPALNARPQAELDTWLTRITTALDAARAADPERKIAPYAVNLIVHHTNDRLEADLETCVRHQVPVIITSLHAPTPVIAPVHAYGGLVFHDVTTVRHAQKALEAGVDGLILVCAGAGGHAGTASPFALLPEIRRFHDGPIILSGSIASGRSILSAQVMGADLAYLGTRFIATTEANAPDGYKSMVLDSAASDIVYTPAFTGVPGNYLKPSIAAAGLDPENLAERSKGSMSWAGGSSKAWKDIWGAGQGVGQIDSVQSVADVIADLAAEYDEARDALAAQLAAGSRIDSVAAGVRA